MLRPFFILILVAFVGIAQAQLEDLLSQIEHNNLTLIALKAELESASEQNKASYVLPGISMGGYYLPIQSNSTDYVEFEITQSLEFPTVYIQRKRMIKAMYNQMDLVYEEKRSSVLLDAHRLLVELSSLNDKISEEEQRTKDAQQVLEYLKEEVAQGNISALDLHKDRLVWMQEMFKLDQCRVEKENLLNQLIQMNGGKELVIDFSLDVDTTALASFEELWEERVKRDPVLKRLEGEREVIDQELKVTKAIALPNVTTGYNYQNAGGSMNAGLFAGISIPLWSNKSNTKSVQAKSLSHRLKQQNVQEKMKIEMKMQCDEYNLLLEKFKAYTKTFLLIDGDTSLLLTYEAGKMSFAEYYMELQFIRDAKDTMLEMKKELNLLRAELLSYKL